MVPPPPNCLSLLEYLFEMSKFNEITKERKIQKLVQPMNFLLQANPPLKNTYLIIDKFSAL